VSDPRTARFFKLRKRAPEQLTASEAREVTEVCELMMDWADRGRTRKGWQELADMYAALADKDNGNCSA